MLLPSPPRDRGSSRSGRGARRTRPPARPGCPHPRCGCPIRGRSQPRSWRRRRRPCRQALEAIDEQPSPGDAAGRDDRPAAQDVAVVEMDAVHVAASIRVAIGRVTESRRRASPACWRARRRLLAGDARREPEVVLDPRRRPRLAAGQLALDDDRAETLRRPVDRSREAGRPPPTITTSCSPPLRLGAGPKRSATRRSCGGRQCHRRRAGGVGSRRPRRSPASSERDCPEGDPVPLQEALELRELDVPSMTRRQPSAAAPRRSPATPPRPALR